MLEETRNLSTLGLLFFDLNKIDSALFYLNLSNTIATEKNFLEILSKNYLTLSEIEEAKGNIKKAYNHFKKYAHLKDSVFNTNIFSDINQLQRLYEVSKTNQQIEQFVVEQHIKERTIYYQNIILFFMLFVLLLVSIGLLYIYLQKRDLNRAYKSLFAKNIEIMQMQEGQSEKFKKKMLSYNMADEILNKILIQMEDTAIICDTEFTIDKLAEMVGSNRVYVSQVINNVLKQNFRTFLNSYRIREAQRLFSESEAQKYTIEFLTFRVGFKSRTAFREAFKEITGMSPTFYLKLVHETEFGQIN
jgi:YesN/AraC family two-component response regulator